MNTFALRPVAVALGCVLALTACGGPPPEPLNELDLTIPASWDAVLVSLKIDPDERLSVSTVEPEVTSGLEATYLGFVSRCSGLCGTHEWEKDFDERIRGAVEGTLPLHVEPGAGSTYPLFKLEVTEEGRERFEDGECVALQSVHLDVGDRRIRVTRKTAQFLWVISGTEDHECLDRVQVNL